MSPTLLLLAYRTALVDIGRYPPIDEGGRSSVHVQGMGTGVVPFATDDNPYLPYIRTTEECGGLVACPWYPSVELQLYQYNAWIFVFAQFLVCIPINVLSSVTTNFFFILMLFWRLRGITR